MEIFFLEMQGKLPAPIFDTQVAAMVCGHGEQASYEHLVSAIAKKKLDKSCRFTNWAQRPLTKDQLEYAICDVTHLRDVYKQLDKELEKKKRKTWIKDEMKVLTSKDTYEYKPEDAWKRVKINTNSRKALGILQELAAWREEQAQKHDIPRNRMFRDESLANIALNPPKTQKELGDMRGLQGGLAESQTGKEIMEAIKRGQSKKVRDLPERKKSEPMPSGLGPSIELLKVLLKMRSEESGVAHRMIATVADIEQLAAYQDKAEVDALTGWRKKLFGNDALKLLNGKLALSLENHQVKITSLETKRKKP
jgi:ribonuclease D